MRLDLWLAQRLELSRSIVQKRIANGAVLVNGKAATAHHKVRAGDVVIMALQTEEPAPTAEAPDPTVVAETDDYLVLEKPAGLLMHPAPATNEFTLLDWLLRYDKNIVAVGPADRPGLVHRLDRDVSGLVVVAKAQPMFDALQQQFRERQIWKRYSALVHDGPPTDEGTIRLPLARSDRHHGRIAARPVGSEGREAVTQYTVVERLRTTTLLAVRILTGRTHQIRAHLFAVQMPVVGDTLYRPKKPHRLPPLDRLFLHASELRFTDLRGEWKEFSSPLPLELAAYLAALRKGKHRN